MKVPFNVPIELNDSFIISSAIKSMKIYTDISKNRNDEFSELYMRTILILLESAYNSRDEYANLPKYPKLNSLTAALRSPRSIWWASRRPASWPPARKRL